MSATAFVAALRHPGRAEIAAAEMHGDRHARRAAGAGGVHQVGIDVQQPVRIVAAAAQVVALRLVAEIGHVDLVELQVGAARFAEGAHRLGVGLSEIGEERLHLGIGRLLDRLTAAAIMQRRRRRDGHLGHRLGHRLQVLEVVDHGMRGREVDLAVHMQALGLGLRALELQALRHAHQFDAVEMAEEIVVPPRAPELAVGHRLQADRFLPGHELADLGILDRLQPGRRDLAGGAFGARLLDRRAAQQASDLVGAERRFAALHPFFLLHAGPRASRPAL